MKICDKCRCNDICRIKEAYNRHYTAAQDAYDPMTPSFEVTIRCKSYIPEKKVMSNGAKGNSAWRGYA